VGLVIFDCDGVLVDSEPISAAVLAGALSAAGLATTPEESRRRYQGLMQHEVVAKAELALGRPLPADFLDRYQADRNAEFRKRLQPVPGAADAVRTIRAAGIAVCVATQAGMTKVELTLGLTGLRGLFDDGAVFSADSVPRGKPYPDLFLSAARTMGADPGQCLVVEDSPSGVRAAVAAKMRVLGYAATPQEVAPLQSAGATVIGSLTEVPALLGLGQRPARLS
jgi:HAD superfamily hydrolase (TIGR01509 family)